MPSKIRKGKSLHWVKVQRKSSTGFPEFSSQGVTQNTIRPASNCDNRYGISTKTQCPRLYLGGWSHRLLLLGHVPKFQTPRRKLGILCKSHCLYSLGIGNHSSQWGNSEPSQNVNSQMPAKGQPCEETFLRIAVSGLFSEVAGSAVPEVHGQRANQVWHQETRVLGSHIQMSTPKASYLS